MPKDRHVRRLPVFQMFEAQYNRYRVCAFFPCATGGWVGVAGTRAGAEHPGLAGGGGRRHPGEENGRAVFFAANGICIVYDNGTGRVFYP